MIVGLTFGVILAGWEEGKYITFLKPWIDSEGTLLSACRSDMLESCINFVKVKKKQSVLRITDSTVMDKFSLAY